ncbi:hypothetical protein ANCDUO_00572 [Ancylostoma duodenale]|uniref:Uncharacterized protein n=1 Tax=Ancylostoma duodenale TaxID=51022 RepID=A0A0C2HBQ2_9BILA|nr:hypothetical protein ANCDUO_00572 [Ancylostoma duodenale]
MKRTNIQNEFGVCGWILTILSYLLIFVTLPISACMCIKCFVSNTWLKKGGGKTFYSRILI